MNSNNKIVIGILMATVIIGIIVCSSKSGPNIDSVVLNPIPADVATTTFDTEGRNVYTNLKYGLSFTYPREWYMSHDHLDYGSLQILNYHPNPDSGGKGFAPHPMPDGTFDYPDVNKIEAVVLSYNEYIQAPDFPEKSIKQEAIVINKQEISRYDIEFESGIRLMVYYVPVPGVKNQYLAIDILGNPKNFSVLDDLVKSIQWIK